MRVSQPPPKPLMLFDGECLFCRQWVERWKQYSSDGVEYRASQEVSLPEIPAEVFARSVVLIETDGSVFTGAEAVFRSLGKAHWYRYIGPLAEAAYRFVADHRMLFSRLTRWLWGESVVPPSYARTREVFLRALGGIYVIAFVSFWVQMPGLIGARGILPAAQLMQALREQILPHHGWAAYWWAPTLCWFNASDLFLHLLCAVGVVAALMVMAGFAVLPALVVLWGLYLSLVVVSDVFLAYQWDALLLETGFLAILFAWGKPEPSRAVLWLLRLLLFKLMFFSGVVKLASGDPLWRTCTALTVHYQTQPLPHALAWYAHQLPTWVHQWSCVAMFGIELVLPVLIFLPRRPRFVAAGGFVLLQALIILTGNYTFFNLLTMVLCLVLLDDRLLGSTAAFSFKGRRRRIRRWVTVPVAVLITLWTVVQTVQVSRLKMSWPRPVRWLHTTIAQIAHPFRSLNTYGLFAVMTPRRPELIIEGSHDGQNWRPYEFKYKPGDPGRRPRWVAPHQPRLDWQMWFEALRAGGQPSRWFLQFCARLLEGEPTVTRLLAHNPFPDQPPRWLRVVVYDYRFTTPTERAATGAWWQRELLGLYLPVLSLHRESALPPICEQRPHPLEATGLAVDANDRFGARRAEHQP